jgi:ATP-dependent RNA helicase RhlE
LDLGFMPSIRKIMSRLPKKRQTVMMSATMPPQIRKLATDFQNNPVEVSVAAVSKPIERISQSVKHVGAPNKRIALAEILSENKKERSIVFTRTKRGADKVTRHLEGAGLSAAAIHGNKSQSQRERALASFRGGEITVLVATDIAARGIDVDDVSLVVNYELPHVSESYVHRIGRTARAGKSGRAISLCDPAEQDLLRSIEKLIGNRIDSLNEPLPASSADPANAGKAKKQSRRKTPANQNSPDQKKSRKPKAVARTSNRRKGQKSDASDDMAGLKYMLKKSGTKNHRRAS